LAALSVAVLDLPASAQALGAMGLTHLKKVDAVAAGADATGTRDSAPAFAAAVAGGSVSLYIPCGTFRLLANVPLSSNTEVVGAGDCTQLLVDPRMKPNALFTKVLPTTTNVRSVFSNADFVHGDSNIAIRNLRVIAPISLVSGQYDAFAFYRAAQITIDKTSVEGRGTIHDGNHTVFIDSRDFRFTNNRHTGGGGEGSFDIWDGSSDFIVSNFYCDGGNAIQRCITVNGISSGNVKEKLLYRGKQSKYGIISRNTVKNVKNVGIMVVGLYNAGPPGVYGDVDNITVINNIIDGVSRFHGIWIGEAENITATNNTIRNAARSCIYVASGGPVGKTSHINLIENRCVNSGKEGAIVIGNSSDAPEHLLLERNKISYTGRAAPYAYDILAHRNVRDIRLAPGAMMPGNIGIVRGVEDGGSSTRSR
jgi:hypothetical protein